MSVIDEKKEKEIVHMSLFYFNPQIVKLIINQNHVYQNLISKQTFMKFKR